ncbi:MAG: DUF3276 family protein [Chitinophagales bacterium]|nr:DUF3276 family protein [Chitinophagales bacterium]
MENNNNGKYSGFYSKKLKAGKRRTYFFDVRSTKQGDFFLTITESKKKFEGEGYESHKIFLYKEDFKKFLEGLNETVDYIKTELMPEYDYDSERPVKTANSDGQADGFSENGKYNSSLNGNGTENHKEQKTTSIVDNTSTDTNPTSTPPISDDEQIDWN